MLDLSTHNNRHHPAGCHVLLLTTEKKRERVKRRKIPWVENLKLDEELSLLNVYLSQALSNKTYLQSVVRRKSCVCRKKHSLRRRWHCFPLLVECITPQGLLFSEFLLFRHRTGRSYPEKTYVYCFHVTDTSIEYLNSLWLQPTPIGCFQWMRWSPIHLFPALSERKGTRSDKH